MVRCNLSILLAEQNLKITKVSNDTGISRTTLTSLANNYGKGIQFDTINQLCLYLKVTPEQLIAFVPVDIEIEFISLLDKECPNVETLEINLSITERGKHYKCNMFGEYSMGLRVDSSEVHSIDLDISLLDPKDNEHIRDEIEEENSIIINAFKKLTRPFLSDIEDTIFSNLMFVLTEENVGNYTFSDDIVFSCNWPKELAI